MTFPECRDPHVARATDEIDAAMFSGDAFHMKDNREHLRHMMARWEREMLELEKEGAFDNDDE